MEINQLYKLQTYIQKCECNATCSLTSCFSILSILIVLHVVSFDHFGYRLASHKLSSSHMCICFRFVCRIRIGAKFLSCVTVILFAVPVYVDL